MHRQVKEVAYPHVMVSQAEFLGISNNSPRGSPPVSKPASARGGGTADVTSPGSAHNTSSCACPTAGQLHFTLVPGDNAPSQAHTVLLSSGCDANSVHMSSSGSPCTESAAQLDIFLQQCTTVTLNGEDFVDYRAIASSTVGGAAYIELNAPGWSTANAGPNRNSALSFVMNWCA